MQRQARPVLIAPDKFRGTLSAEQVAGAIARGLSRAGIDADRCRIADGGEGTIAALLSAGPEGGAIELADFATCDALGRPVDATVAWLDGRTALIESASAIGLDLISPTERDAMAASSRGVGDLIAAVAASGAREVLVAIGGTASTDGGRGAIDLLRERGLVGRRGALKNCPRIVALCDVRAGWDQAAPIFAAQKGASGEQVAELAVRLDELARALPKDPRGQLLTGAGGGLSGGLWAACGAELESGAAWVLDRLGFNERMLAARAVITGEGTLDAQTLLGKAVGEVATRARQAGVPCHAIVGRMAMSEFDARILDIESVTEAGYARAISAAAEGLAAVLASY